MNAGVRDCLVENYSALIPSLVLPDPNDRHVLAAAIVAEADLIITCNLRDFPRTNLKKYGIEAQHPDEFIGNLIRLAPTHVCSVVATIRARLRNPPMSPSEYIDTPGQHSLPNTARKLRSFEDQIQIFPATTPMALRLRPIDPATSHGEFTFFLVDETGNMGNDWFDPEQPSSSLGTLSSSFYPDALANPAHVCVSVTSQASSATPLHSDRHIYPECLGGWQSTTDQQYTWTVRDGFTGSPTSGNSRTGRSPSPELKAAAPQYPDD